MKKHYTAPQADLTCFEPWENVALVDLNGGNNGGNISFGDLWAAANKEPSGQGAVWTEGDISVNIK